MNHCENSYHFDYSVRVPTSMTCASFSTFNGYDLRVSPFRRVIAQANDNKSFSERENPGYGSNSVDSQVLGGFM